MSLASQTQIRTAIRYRPLVKSQRARTIKRKRRATRKYDFSKFIGESRPECAQSIYAEPAHQTAAQLTSLSTKRCVKKASGPIGGRLAAILMLKEARKDCSFEDGFALANRLNGDALVRRSAMAMSGKTPDT